MLGWVRGGLACVCSCCKCQGLTQTVLTVLIFRALVSAKVVTGQKCLCCFKQILLPGEYLPCWCLEPDLPWLPPSTTWEKEKERNYGFQKIMRRSSETCFLFAAGISISPRYVLKTIKNKVFFFPFFPSLASAVSKHERIRTDNKNCPLLVSLWVLFPVVAKSGFS